VVEENGTPNAATLRRNTKFSLCFGVRCRTHA
jgi:hypothetical protein